jgi:hypothetical protein
MHAHSKQLLLLLLLLLQCSHHELLRCHGLQLSEAERRCVAYVCGIGFMSPLEIRELGLEVSLTSFESEGLDKPALAARLDAASFADLLALVESLGF